jgi:hypothetical protein
MNESTRFVGPDVHKASIAVAVVGAFGEPEDHGRITNDPSTVRKLLVRLGEGGVRLTVAYEAGPTAYALYRQVTGMGIACIVVAPSLIPVQPGDRIKTDRRDAAKLARLLGSSDLTPVWVPDEAGEAPRDLVCARADANEDQLWAKHRLSKLLLRRAVHPPLGVRAWSRAHEACVSAGQEPRPIPTTRGHSSGDEDRVRSLHSIEVKPGHESGNLCAIRAEKGSSGEQGSGRSRRPNGCVRDGVDVQGSRPPSSRCLRASDPDAGWDFDLESPVHESDVRRIKAGVATSGGVSC